MGQSFQLALDSEGIKNRLIRSLTFMDHFLCAYPSVRCGKNQGDYDAPLLSRISQYGGQDRVENETIVPSGKDSTAS